MLYIVVGTTNALGVGLLFTAGHFADWHPLCAMLHVMLPAKSLLLEDRYILAALYRADSTPFLYGCCAPLLPSFVHFHVLCAQPTEHHLLGAVTPRAAIAYLTDDGSLFHFRHFLHVVWEA